MLLVYHSLYLLHLKEGKLAGQNHHVGKLGIEAQAFAVGYAELGGNMDLQAETAGICYGCHIRGYNRRNACFGGQSQSLPHFLEVLVVKGYVECEIRPHAVLAADAADLGKVFSGEVVGRVRPHIQAADSEIDGIRSALNGGLQALEIARRGHYLQLPGVHCQKRLYTIPLANSIRQARWSRSRSMS